MSLREDLTLATHFLAELFTREFNYERTTEPEVMTDPEGVRQYRDAVQAEGNGSSVHLFNLMLLCGAIKPGDTIVDLACGPAGLLIEVAKLNPESHFIGVDLSDEMLGWANAQLHSDGVKNVRLVRGDITRLDFLQDQSADLVMSTLSLHHLPDERLLEACLREIGRIVRRSGGIYLLDFASFKRTSSIDYFARQRTKDLEAYVAADYEASMKAAFRKDVFEKYLPILQVALPSTVLRSTFGVPFFAALTSINHPQFIAGTAQALHAYWGRMKPRQRKDFGDLRLFFGLSGLKVPRPESLNKS